MYYVGDFVDYTVYEYIKHKIITPTLAIQITS